MSAAVRLAIFAGLLALANCEIQSLSQIKAKKVPFTACIDDSDCAEQGQDYACFQYLCYPWKDDNKLPKTDKKKTCKSNDHCDPGQECYRHPDRRNIYRGLCMEPVVDCSENGESDCKQPGNKGRGSCHVHSPPPETSSGRVNSMNVILYSCHPFKVYFHFQRNAIYKDKGIDEIFLSHFNFVLT